MVAWMSARARCPPLCAGRRASIVGDQLRGRRARARSSRDESGARRGATRRDAPLAELGERGDVDVAVVQMVDHLGHVLGLRSFAAAPRRSVGRSVTDARARARNPFRLTRNRRSKCTDAPAAAAAAAAAATDRTEHGAAQQPAQTVHGDAGCAPSLAPRHRAADDPPDTGSSLCRYTRSVTRRRRRQRRPDARVRRRAW